MQKPGDRGARVGAIGAFSGIAIGCAECARVTVAAPNIEELISPAGLLLGSVAAGVQLRPTASSRWIVTLLGTLVVSLGFAALATSDGRSGTATVKAVSLLAAGTTILLLRKPGIARRRVAVTIMTLLGLTALYVLVGYSYGMGLDAAGRAPPLIFGIGLTFLTIALGALLRDEQPLSVVFGDSDTAAATRRLLPPLILFPLILGWLRLHGETSGIYAAAEAATLFTVFIVATLVVLLIWNATRLVHAEAARERLHQNLRKALEVQDAISTSRLDTKQVIDRVVERTNSLLGTDGAALATLENERLHYRTAIGSLAALAGNLLPLAGTLAGQAVESNALVRAKTHTLDRSLDAPLHGAAPDGVVVAMPLRYGGYPVGVLVVAAQDGNALTRDETDILQIVSGSAGAALMHAAQFETRLAFLRRQSDEITTLQQKFSAFMDNVPAATFIKDEDGRYVYANDGVTRLFRREVTNVLGRTDYEILDPGRAGETTAGDREVRRGSGTVSSIVRLFDDDDAPFWMLLRFGIEDAAGRRSIGGVAIDVTDVKRAEAQVAAINADLEKRVADRTAQLESANRELESFAYSVSHDLRAPLRAIAGYSRMVEEDYAGAVDDEGRRFLAIIRSEAHRMGRLIDDLLAFSGIGRQTIASAHVDMTALFHEVALEVRAMHPNRRFDFYCPSLPPAAGDRQLLRQVVTNLLGNAAKYARAHEPIRIEVTGQRHGENNVYTVRDEGVGFDSRHAKKIFQVFQRLHSSAEFEGTGVGLAIVDRIVTRHGGRVWAEGEVGKGARFSFTLPAAEERGEGQAAVA